MPVPSHLRSELIGSEEQKRSHQEHLSPPGQSAFDVDDLVQAHDRDNFGRVVGISSDGRVRVTFRNPGTGATRTRSFPPDQLTRIEHKPSARPENGDGRGQPEPPRPLSREMPPAPPYPIDALGPILKSVTIAIHQAIQAPLALCAQAVLAAAALAVQAHGNILIDGRIIPLALYLLSIGATGERKSAVDSEALKPHRDFQDSLSRANAQEVLDYENNMAAWKKAREESLKKAKGYAAKRLALTELGPPPAAPLVPILMAQEPTFPGLVKLMLVSRPSMGVFSDEGGTFIAGHAMNEDNRTMTASGLSSLWDGKTFSRVRSGDGAAILRGRRLSIHLMAQPNIGASLFDDPLLIHQGLMSRFLVTWPDSTAGRRPYVSKDLSSDPDVSEYVSRLKEILRLPLPTSSFSLQELEPPAISLSAKAKTLWIKFHDSIEVQLAKDGELEPIRGFGNKVPEHALRLAGVLTLFSDPDAREIDLSEMGAGIELAQFYTEEALRVFNAGAVNEELKLAARLLDWLHSQKKEFVALHEIYQFGPNSIRDAKTARSTANLLVDHGWLVAVKGGKEIDGVRRKEVWEVVYEEI